MKKKKFENFFFLKNFFWKFKKKNFLEKIFWKFFKIFFWKKKFLKIFFFEKFFFKIFLNFLLKLLPHLPGTSELMSNILSKLQGRNTCQFYNVSSYASPIHVTYMYIYWERPWAPICLQLSQHLNNNKVA